MMVEYSFAIGKFHVILITYKSDFKAITKYNDSSIIEIHSFINLMT
jgi:hypothetical protein